MDLKCPTVIELQITHCIIILTKQAVGLQEVLKEALANIRIQEVKAGEQVMKPFHLTTLNLYRVKQTRTTLMIRTDLCNA